MLTVLLALLSLAMQPIAAQYTGNPDIFGRSWEGPITFQQLKLQSWLLNLESKGADTSNVLCWIDSIGTVYINKGAHELDVTPDQYDAAATVVSRTATGEALDLTQLDYFAYTTYPDADCKPVSQIDPQRMVHSNIMIEGAQEKWSPSQQVFPISDDDHCANCNAGVGEGHDLDLRSTDDTH